MPLTKSFRTREGMKLMYKTVSLFCGCGGGDLGTVGNFTFNGKKYAELPFNISLALDNDRKAINTLRRNFKDVSVLCSDICETPSHMIPDHDVLTGGFPCQSFSTVNPTKNPYDERGNLYKEMVRIVSDKRPKVFIAENVKGFMLLQKGTIFEKVLKEFSDVGYKTYFKLMNAADYGIPQKRERVIIVGVRNDIKKKYSFPIPESAERTPLSAVVPELAIKDKKYYFSKKAVEGMKKAKNNMKRGLAQNLDEPCLTVTSHLSKVSLNSRDPVLLVDPKKELYRRFTPKEAAGIQSFPENFVFEGTEADAYRQIGNAIPPVLFWHIMKNVAELLDGFISNPKK